MLKHRNSQKRIYFKDACYFISCKTHNNFPYFRKRIFCDLFMENLRICKQLKGFLLYGWVLLHDHFHLMVQPGDDFNVSKIMKSLKENSSYMINEIMKPEGATLTSRLLQKINNNHFDFTNFQSKFHQKYPFNHPFSKFRWQKSFHDHYIRNENDFDYHMEYIAYNPVKHQLPTNWPYISFNPKYEYLIDKY